jgi:hypothetical protein
MMSKLLFRALLLLSCIVAGGNLAVLLIEPDLSQYAKISSIMSICSMLLVIPALILNQKKALRKKK